MKLPSVQHPDWLPYVLPMGAFLLLTSAESTLTQKDGATDPTLYAVVYAAKVIIVCGLMIACRSTWRDLLPKPDVRILALACVSGLLVTALWVSIPSPPIPYITGENSRVGFDPGQLSPWLRVPFLAVRFFGLVLMVPLFEELFWRSFLMRWVTAPDFTQVGVGQVSAKAAAITSVCFALVHPEWLPALITGLLWAGLLWKTRRLSACVISHAVANLGLGLYVLATGKWYFW